MCDLTRQATCQSRRYTGVATTRGSNIGEHALRLAIQIQTQQPPGTPSWEVFQFLGRMVASCVFYDCIRNRRGGIRDIFSEYYQPSLERMLETFCNDHRACSFFDRSNRPCTGTRLSHGVEHRTTNGKIIGTGEHQSSFTAESFLPNWISFLKTELNACEDDYLEASDEEPPEISGRKIASNLHLEQMNDFFTDLGIVAPFISHASCFGCLVDIPQHPLPCGHVLCDNCVRDCGRRAHGKIQLDHCPLHMHTSFEQPWQVRYHSDYMGVRILSLDGGGMRGIMELEVLRAIEKSLGGNIRIQSFFDLIIGTSTGGINALALGVKQWSVKHCITEFEKFCDQAFTEREFGGVWGLEKAALLNHGSKYKAKPLHNVLQEAFGRNILFGAKNSFNACRTKVAVTTTSGDGSRAMLLANYNRSKNPGDSQAFVRPEDPSDELEVWEAAAATSAAPLYFKPYTHQKTGAGYIDGGLYHNNPVHVANRERKLLWPELANKHPDMLLSIGTGQNLSEPRREASERRSSSPKGEDTPNAPVHESRGIRRTLKAIGALYQRFDNILDAENAWTDFEADINNRNDDFPSPYIRVNLDLKRKLPPFDAKDKFQELRADVRQRLKDPDMVEMTRDVACSLVASSFHFKLAKTVPHRGGSFTCTGYICCKFEEGSSNLKALGEFLLKQCTPTFKPEFIVKETSRCTPDRGVKVKLTDKLISRLVRYGMLRIPHIDFEVSNPMASTAIALVLKGGCQDGAQRYLLSGFPRTLVQEAPCRPPKTTHNSHSTSSSAKPDHRSYQQPQAVGRERRQTHNIASANPPLPYRPSQAGPYLSTRPTSSTSQPQRAAHSRIDSAVVLAQNTRISTPPRQTPLSDARPRSVPVYQAFSYDRSSPASNTPTYLAERAARKVHSEDGKKSRKGNGGNDHTHSKRLVKKKGE